MILKYLCCGSSINGVLNSLLDTGSGPSSSSTRKPNSSNLEQEINNFCLQHIPCHNPGYLNSGCSFGSSVSFVLFNFTNISCGTIEGISAEKGPPGLISPGGICPSPDIVIPSDTSILNSPSSSSAQATWEFCLEVKRYEA